MKNKDGSLTLSFGYFNLDQVDVRIQPGEGNTFLPRPLIETSRSCFEQAAIDSHAA